MPGPEVFLINLDGSSDRLRRADEQLRQVGVAYHRVSAFDGRRLDPATFPDCDYDRCLRLMGRPIRGAEIGCYLSHIEAARRFLATKAPFGLVLEDDFRFLPHSWPLIDALVGWCAERPINWDVINLGHRSHKIYTSVADLLAGGSHTRVTRAHYFPMTTSALLWSADGARAFVDGHDRIFLPVDNYLRDWQSKRGRGLAVWPPIVSTIGAVSEIDLAAGEQRSSSGRLAGYGLRKQYQLFKAKARALRQMIGYRFGG